MTDGTEFEVTEIPEEYREQAEEYREKLIEAVAELDEDLMEKYLDGEEITKEELKAAIRKGTLMLNSTLFFVVLLSKTKVFN